jgi:hypothetical protein
MSQCRDRLKTKIPALKVSTMNDPPSEPSSRPHDGALMSLNRRMLRLIGGGFWGGVLHRSVFWLTISWQMLVQILAILSLWAPITANKSTQTISSRLLAVQELLASSVKASLQHPFSDKNSTDDSGCF